MAFNRPGNGRDDKSGRSSNRTPKGGDKPKRSSSTRGNSSSSPDKAKSTRPSKKYNNEEFGEKKSFSSSDSRGGKSSYDKSPSSFTGGEKKAFVPKGRPYTGRPTDGGAGEKKSFAPRKPYSGRVAGYDDSPKRSFGGESSGEKKSFGPKKSYSGRAGDSEDRPKRSFNKDTAGEGKPFASRGRSSASNDDRPKRSFNKDAAGEGKPFASRSRSSAGNDDRPKRSADGYKGSSDRPADKRTTGRPSTGGYKKADGERPYTGDRPARSKTSYDKITPDESVPAKTLRGRKKGPESKDSGLIRLNRYISNAGICSRRKADELIAAGVVAVNGIVISELGHKVDPMKDEIKYNGETLRREKMVYVLLNKPKDYITTTEDPQERRTVMHLVEKASKERIYPIGRLDRNTTGLLLMTNDGDLADKLSHPRNNIVKLYQVELSKSLTQGDLNKIAFGLELEDGLIKPDSISYVAGGSKREIGIQIHSGKNRIVRRIFEHLGYEVVKLDRAVYANLTKKDLPRGRWRFLEEKEIIQLKHLV